MEYGPMFIALVENKENVFLCLAEPHTKKTCGTLKIQINASLTSTPDGREQCYHTPSRDQNLNHLILMDQCIVDDSVEIPKRCSFVIEFIIPKFIEGSTCFERHTAHHQEL